MSTTRIGIVAVLGCLVASSVSAGTVTTPPLSRNCIAAGLGGAVSFICLVVNNSGKELNGVQVELVASPAFGGVFQAAGKNVPVDGIASIVHDCNGDDPVGPARAFCRVSGTDISKTKTRVTLEVSPWPDGTCIHSSLSSFDIPCEAVSSHK
jgi:hypothetical protein